MDEIEHIHSLKYSEPEYLHPNPNSGPLKKMCVVCVELGHSTHTKHKDTRYTDEEFEIQRKLPR